MNILAILLSPPVPSTAGHRVRNRGLLQALALEGHDVTVVAYGSSEEIASPSREFGKLCREFHLVTVPSNRMPDRMRAVFGSKPYGALRLTTPTMQSLVQEQLATREFDAILCDDIYMAGNIPASNRVPVLLNKHDITCRIVRQFADAERNLAKKYYALLESRKIQRLEATTCESADRVAVCSQCDLDVLRNISPTASLSVLSNVIDVTRYPHRAAGDGHTVLFVGAMDWLPNQDGAEFLVFDILPRLRQLAPTARVVIAGRNPSGSMLQRFGEFPDVSFTGTVPDLRPIIAKAAVCVVPLRIGSGTRLKILEAAAMAKPIVSTTLGAEGLEFCDGKEILLEDQPRAFAEAVACLLAAPHRSKSLGDAARVAVERQYSIAALRLQLRELLATLQSNSVASVGCTQ